MAAVESWPVPWLPLATVEAWPIFLGLIWPPWGRGRFPGSRMAAVGVGSVSWAPYSRREGVADFPWPRMAAVRAWSVPGPLMAAMGAWPVFWAAYGRRGGVANPLGPGLPL